MLEIMLILLHKILYSVLDDYIMVLLCVFGG